MRSTLSVAAAEPARLRSSRKSGASVLRGHRVCRVYGRCAAERSLAGSAAATGGV